MNRIDLIIDIIVNDIIKNNERYLKNGFIIFLNGDEIEIDYKDKIYFLTIHEEDNNIFWLIKCNEKIIKLKITDNFDEVLDFIINSIN